jgi:hypothetical protein
MVTQTRRQTSFSVDLSSHTNRRFLKEVRVCCRRYENVADASNPPVPLEVEACHTEETLPGDTKANSHINENAQRQLCAVTQVLDVSYLIVRLYAPLEVRLESVDVFYALRSTLLNAIHRVHNEPPPNFSSKAVYYVIKEIYNAASRMIERCEEVEVVQHASSCALGTMRGEKVRWMGSEVHMGMYNFIIEVLG